MMHGEAVSYADRISALARRAMAKLRPAQVFDKLHGEINRALADPTFNAHVADLGYAVFPSSQAEFGSFIAADTEKWGKVIKTAKIKRD
jgi:tripartite-type tricarboxylate transporter receptor subunit TctC